jgi:hypothetical protein
MNIILLFSNITLYYSLRFYFPYLSLFAKPLKIFVYWPVNILVYGLDPINIMFSSRFCPNSFFVLDIQLTLVISNSMEPWKKIESTVVWLKRSYENTGSVVCLTTKGRQLERNFEELKPASHVPIPGTILNIFRCFCCCFFLCVDEYVYLFCLCFSAVALSLNFTHHDVFFLCAILFIYNLFNKV